MTVRQEDADFLAHYGQKGMKWGQRKAAAPSKTTRSKKRNRASSSASEKIMLGATFAATIGVVALNVAMGYGEIKKKFTG